METLGSLCDKLTIVKLKQWHSDNETKLSSLKIQESQLINEIDTFIFNALSGSVSPDKLKFSANKVYKIEGNEFRIIDSAKIGVVFAELANINCSLWHEQEKIYEFEKIADEKKNEVVKKLALLNLERTYCIDKIDNILYELVLINSNDLH